MIRVAVFNAHGRRRVPPSFAAGVVKSTLRGEGITSAAITVVFSNARSSRSVNRRFLGHDRATDVISFPLESGPVLEGEIHVNLDRAVTQAAAYGVTVKNEITRLVVHGVLHLAGYDDRRPGPARRMRARQESYVARILWEGNG